MSNISGSSKKVRNANRGPGYWLSLHNSRAHHDRVLVARVNRDWPSSADTGSAAYRRASH